MLDFIPVYAGETTEASSCAVCSTCATCAACLGDGPIPDFEGVGLAGLTGIFGLFATEQPVAS